MLYTPFFMIMACILRLTVLELILHAQTLTHKQVVIQVAVYRYCTVTCVRLGSVTKLLFQTHSAAWVKQTETMSNSDSVTSRWRNSSNASMQSSIYITFTAAFINLKEHRHRIFMSCREFTSRTVDLSFCGQQSSAVQGCTRARTVNGAPGWRPALLLKKVINGLKNMVTFLYRVQCKRERTLKKIVI
jgi:hypothetical protein